MAGSYLETCTMYASFFRRSPVGAYHPTTLHPDTAGLLQAVAAMVVLDSLATWNIGALDPDPAFTWFDLGAGTFQFSTTSPATMTHLWSFGDGGTSAVSDPDHAYGAPGTYTVWHVVTDACGRTDSAAVELSVGGVSVPEPGTSSPRAWCDAEAVHFDAPGAGLLRLVHADGRLAGERRIVGPGLMRLAVTGAAGPLLWTFRSEDGGGWRGLLVRP